MIECLLELNANPLLADSHGKTAMMYMIPIRNSTQAAENPVIADRVKKIIEKMKAFSINLAQERNEYLAFAVDGRTTFYPKASAGCFILG